MMRFYTKWYWRRLLKQGLPVECVLENTWELSWITNNTIILIRIQLEDSRSNWGSTVGDWTGKQGSITDNGASNGNIKNAKNVANM